MSLATRIQRLENTAGWRRELLPEMIVSFIEPVRGEDGIMREGRSTGGLRLMRGGGQQWLDADMNPIAGPA